MLELSVHSTFRHTQTPRPKFIRNPPSTRRNFLISPPVCWHINWTWYTNSSWTLNLHRYNTSSVGKPFSCSPPTMQPPPHTHHQSCLYFRCTIRRHYLHPGVVNLSLPNFSQARLPVPNLTSTWARIVWLLLCRATQPCPYQSSFSIYNGLRSPDACDTRLVTGRWVRIDSIRFIWSFRSHIVRLRIELKDLSIMPLFRLNDTET